MKGSLLTKILLIVIAGLMALNLVIYLNLTKKAEAEQGRDSVGRYQIAAWAAQAGARTHHNGYYIVDTVTGKIVDSGAEIHTEEEIEKVIKKKE